MTKRYKIKSYKKLIETGRKITTRISDCGQFGNIVIGDPDTETTHVIPVVPGEEIRFKDHHFPVLPGWFILSMPDIFEEIEE